MDCINVNFFLVISHYRLGNGMKGTWVSLVSVLLLITVKNL